MPKILLIDDEALILELLSEMLEEEGYQVAKASNGKDGVELFRKKPTDVIITDIIMPEKEGLSTIFELKKDYPNVKIIAISGGGGQGTGDYLEAAKKFGALYTFSKPVRKKPLLTAIENLLDEEELVHIRAEATGQHNVLLCCEPSRDLNYLKEALPLSHFLPFEAHTPKEALELVKAHDIALVFVEDHEPKSEGLLIAHKLIQSDPLHPPPVVLISDSFSNSMAEKSYAIGAVDYLVKPISSEIIFHKTRVLIRLNQHQRGLKKQSQNMEDALKIQCSISDNLITTAKALKESKKQVEEVYSELERLNQEFQLFVPKPFLTRISAQKSIVSGRFDEEKFTILFSDIRGYTHLSEGMTPQENFDFLNAFFSLMEPPITQNGGFIDKFMGDGIMALFDQDDSANHALQAAIEMQKALSLFSGERLRQGLPEVRMGIGINTGPVMVGALGSANRLNSTVLGDHVNLGARLEELTKKFHVQILISEHTYRRLDFERFLIREIDKVKVRGKSQPVTVYEVFDCDIPDTIEEKVSYQSDFSKGIQLYKSQEFSEALTLFQKCLDKTCQDVVVFEYIKRCDYFEKYPPSLDWEGTVLDTQVLIEHSHRRRTPRYALNTPLNIYPNTHAPHLAGLTLDVSLHGLKIEVSRGFEVGTLFFVEVFLLTGDLEQYINQTGIKVLGKVAWSQQISKSVHRVGMEMIVATPEGSTSFKKALKQLKPEGES